MTVFLCTDCPERCILTKLDHDCGKIGDRIWLHREEVLCRFCPNVEETCYHCVRIPDKEEYKKIHDNYNWKEHSTRLYEEYLNRKQKKNT